MREHTPSRVTELAKKQSENEVIKENKERSKRWGGREGRTYHAGVVVALVVGVILHLLLLLVDIRVSGAVLPLTALVVVTLLPRHLELLWCV